jgi:hypothetical protein
MPRFFVSNKLTSPDNIDFESSDMAFLFAIRENGVEFDIEKVVFDFSVSTVDSHTVSNRIHTSLLRKSNVDGVLANIVRPGRRSREVTEGECKIFFETLLSKSNHMKKKRRCKQIFSEERIDLPSKLP